MERYSLVRVGPILVLGAGGHAKVVIEAIRAAGGTVQGVLDPNPTTSALLGAPMLGSDDDLEQLRDAGARHAFVALGNNRLREKICRRIQGLGMNLPTVVHPSAHISPSAQIGEGALVMAKAVVGTETVVEAFGILNTGAVMDHDNHLGIAAHVAPGCALAGNVTIGARAFIGAGCALRPHVTVGADAVVGAGSAVVSDVPLGETYVGVPARPLVRKG